MLKSSVINEKQALIYLTDCLLATVQDMAMKKNRKKNEYERHISIAQTAVNWLKDFGIKIEIGSRAYQVLCMKSQTVKDWARENEA